MDNLISSVHCAKPKKCRIVLNQSHARILMDSMKNRTTFDVGMTDTVPEIVFPHVQTIAAVYSGHFICHRWEFMTVLTGNRDTLSMLKECIKFVIRTVLVNFENAKRVNSDPTRMSDMIALSSV